jgi:hypothetical protein
MIPCRNNLLRVRVLVHAQSDAAERVEHDQLGLRVEGLLQQLLGLVLEVDALVPQVVEALQVLRRHAERVEALQHQLGRVLLVHDDHAPVLLDRQAEEALLLARDPEPEL